MIMEKYNINVHFSFTFHGPSNGKDPIIFKLNIFYGHGK